MAQPLVKLFRPVGDHDGKAECLTCASTILINADRHYIVWDAHHSNGLRKRRGNYRRQCASCYDTVHHRAYERRSSTDSYGFTIETSDTPTVA